MAFSLIGYQQRKEQLYKKADRIKQVLIDREDEETIGQIDDLLKNVEQGKFIITVIGEFSKGKSTFLNSLFGKRLLPSKVTPTTALLNKIVYSEQESFFLSVDGEEKKISEVLFKKLIAPKDPNVTDKKAMKEYQDYVEVLNKIDQITVGYPLPFLKDGVCIYDTPGFNDLDENRSQLTNTIIPKSDAVIFMLNARKQLSLSERSFLEDRVLTQDLGKLFFVINFKDQLNSEEDVKRVKQEVLRHLPTKIENPKIFFISAKYALNFRREQQGETIQGSQWRMRHSAVVRNLDETGIPAFEEDLCRFLEEERGYIKLFKANVRMDHWVDQIINQQIPLEVLSFQQCMVDADQKEFELKNKLEHAHAKWDRLIRQLKSDSKRQLDETKTIYKDRLQQISHVATEELSKQLGGSYHEMAQAVELKISPLEGKLSQDILKLKEEWANKVTEQCAKHMSSALTQNYQSILHLFNADAQTAEHVPLNGSFDDLATLFYSRIMDYAPKNGSVWISGLANTGKALIKFFGRLLGGSKNSDQEVLKQRLKDKFENNVEQKVKDLDEQWDAMQTQLLDQAAQDMERELKKMHELFTKILRNAEVSRNQADRTIQKLEKHRQNLKACMELKPLSDNSEEEPYDHTGAITNSHY
jgi:Dynamin family.